MRYNDGYIGGTGGAQNIEIGFIPSWVKIINQGVPGGKVLFEGPLNEVLAFDGGRDDGVKSKISAGDEIIAGDDGWHATVKEVILTSGAWATNNAAGFLVLEAGTLDGRANVADNDGVFVRPQQGASRSGSKSADVATGLVGTIIELDPEDATAGNRVTFGSVITPYYGDHASKAMGFSVSASIDSADGQLLMFQAWAPDPGSGPVDKSND